MAARTITASPSAYSVKPVTSRAFPARSARRPANGAVNPEASADGAIVRPALSGLKPRMVCR